MKKYFELLKKCPLFEGIEENELSGMLQCLGARTLDVSKNQPVFLEGDPAKYVGIVLSGSVQVVREDYFGNRSMVAVIEPAELFGEAFACAGVETMPVSVIAVRDSELMLMDVKRILTTCRNSCVFHQRLISNLLRVVAAKNLILNRKIEVMSKRTTREKLMAYLLSQAKRHDSSSFTIPYDRQALADYLGVERSAMSAEISKLRKEGVLECDRSFFKLLQDDR